MRSYVYVIVALIGWCQFAQSQDPKDCVGKEDGPVATDDPCINCMCENEEIVCLSESCPMVVCHPKLYSHSPDQCCPTCREGCQHEEFGYMEPNSDASDERGCHSCHCSSDSELECMMMDCLECEGGVHLDDGTCCGTCDMTRCKVNGEIYKDGERIPKDSPCQECYCMADGQQIGEMCYMMACMECFGTWTDDGTCCGHCEPITTCEYKGQQYKEGEVIPTGEPCEYCTCGKMDEGIYEMMCALSMCGECPGEIIDDGSCCGQCVVIDTCRYRGKKYELGVEIPSSNPCESCYCMMNPETNMAARQCDMMVCAIYCEPGFVHQSVPGACCGTCVPSMPDVCATVRCEQPSCPTNMQVTQEGSCCPECKCRYKRKTYSPGPVGDKCSGCVCTNGYVVCNKPVCPKIECVDPVMGEDCCFHCPNGRTCATGSKKNMVVIKEGELVKYRNNMYCFCNEETWFPNAFCAKKKVPSFLTKPYKNQIALNKMRPSK